jgi:enoyl-CoA hydratase
MAFKHILFQVEDGTAWITFNRPKVLNALNSELLAEFSRALDDVADNESARVLILTGAGEKSFVAGADINELAAQNPLSAKQFSQKGLAIIGKLQTLPIPVIAAVNGYALGGGMEIAMACDFIYASDNAVFGQPEINLGLIPGFGGTQRLPRLVGINLAKEMMFTGNMISADEAHRIGVVNRVCPPDTFMDDVKKIAHIISMKGSASLQAAKQAINRGLEVDLVTGLHIETDAFSLCLASQDAKEGTSAFLEKRKPKFTGTLND